jgi:hypothetical protein
MDIPPRRRALLAGRDCVVGQHMSESMPLIKARPNRVRTLRHISRLQEPNRDTLVLYARFIGDTPDYVLNQLIETTIGRDRDFVAWRAEQPAATTDVVAGARRSGRRVTRTDPQA